MSKNWWWHKSGLPIYRPQACEVCGKVVRRIAKHRNHFGHWGSPVST